MRRKTKAPIDDRPAPWEDGPISRERWQKHRNWLMGACAAGTRPQEWWLYEQGREQPKNQSQILFAMGELRGAELAKCVGWWKTAYEEANEVIVAGGSFGTIRKTPAERREYLDFYGVPRALAEQWDAERAKGAA